MRSAIAAMAIALCVCYVPKAAADPLRDFVSLLTSQQPRRPLRALPARNLKVQEVVGHHRMVASFYGGGERLNKRTSNGEVFRPSALTAAHRTLPFGTRLHVCFRGCVVVRVNDRGPAAWTGRSLDLSRGAASRIGFIGPGSGLDNVALLGR